MLHDNQFVRKPWSTKSCIFAIKIIRKLTEVLLWPNWMLHSKPFNSGKRQVHHLWSQYTQFWVIWDMYWKNTQCLSCWTFFINILAPPTITLTIYQKILVQQWQLRWQNGVMATTALHLAVNSYNWKDGDNDYEESYNCESVTACVNQSCGDNKCRESKAMSGDYTSWQFWYCL